MHMLLVCIGGFFGAMARFFVFRIMTNKQRATMTVNTIGSFCIGMAAPVLQQWQQLVFVLGFLGAFTTFSTFALDVVQLKQHDKKGAVLYTVLTLIYGILAVCLGYVVTMLL